MHFARAETDKRNQRLFAHHERWHHVRPALLDPSSVLWCVQDRGERAHGGWALAASAVVPICFSLARDGAGRSVSGQSG
jgi:hypothetical protein